jgi:hypothetical protein
MMRCEEIQEQLSPYLEDELAAGARRGVEDHLRQCGRCQNELGLLRRTVTALRSLEEAEVPRRLVAGVKARLASRETFDWRRLASWLFVPLHVKLPLQAAALLLVSLGAVYLFRSVPELARAPAPPSVATEYATRDRESPRAAVKRSDLDERAGARESAPESVGRKLEDRLASVPRERPAEGVVGQERMQAGGEKQREAQEQKSVGDSAGRFRPEPPAAAKAAPPPELVLRTGDPARATERIAEMVSAIGGQFAPTPEPQRLVLTVPAEAYPKLLERLRELGELKPPAAEPPDSPQGSVTVSVRLVP